MDFVSRLFDRKGAVYQFGQEHPSPFSLEGRSGEELDVRQLHSLNQDVHEGLGIRLCS